MAKLNYAAVSILVVDVDLGSRDSVRTILNNNGFRQIQLASTIDEVQAAIAGDTMIDLIISECQLPSGSFSKLIRDLRHREVGRNPFLPVIGLIAEPTPETVRMAIDSGIDDLLPKPISTAHMIKRIETVVMARKPFVVTSDYIGPDRRKSADRADTIPHFDVPNILKAKVMDHGINDALQEIEDAFAEINLQKLERHAVQIGVLVEMIVPAYAKGQVDATLYQNIDHLRRVAEDTSRRLSGTKYEHISELCQNLIGVAGDIRDHKEQPKEKDLDLLTPLSQAIRNTFNIDEDVAALARMISEKVAKSGNK